MDLGNLRYAVIDLETTTKNTTGRNKASGHCPENEVVASGVYSPDIGYASEYYEPGSLQAVVENHLGLMGFKSIDILVGHNIKFDMHYLSREKIFNEHRKDLVIWDTMLAEYLLERQMETFPSLDYCSKKRGGTLKDDKIKEYWNSGVATEDIPKDELMEYLSHDVMNTNTVFLSQVKEAHNRGMIPLMMSQMEALMATFEMEHNGMHFDYKHAEVLKNDLEREIAMLNTSLRIWMANCGVTDPNPSNNRHISAVLFGGKLKRKVSVPMANLDGTPVLFKTGVRKGQQKFKSVEEEYEIPPAINKISVRTVEKLPSGVYSTSDETLTKLVPVIAARHPVTSAIINDILQLKKLNKDCKTYFQGYMDLTWDDSKIRPNINHCATATGRLSQSNPNMQNVTNKKGDD